MSAEYAMAENKFTGGRAYAILLHLAAAVMARSVHVCGSGRFQYRTGKCIISWLTPVKFLILQARRSLLRCWRGRTTTPPRRSQLSK